MPLIVAPLNQEMKIIKMFVDEKTKRHLENLGILVSAKLTILSKSNGDIIIKVKNGRLAINKETALKILVA